MCSERVAVHAVPVGIGGEAEGSIGGLAAATATDVPAVSPSTARADANNDNFFIVVNDLMVIVGLFPSKRTQRYC